MFLELYSIFDFSFSFWILTLLLLSYFFVSLLVSLLLHRHGFCKYLSTLQSHSLRNPMISLCITWKSSRWFFRYLISNLSSLSKFWIEAPWHSNLSSTFLMKSSWDLSDLIGCFVISIYSGTPEVFVLDPRSCFAAIYFNCYLVNTMKIQDVSHL